jgi:anti-anti-sigma regulatory factor
MNDPSPDLVVESEVSRGRLVIRVVGYLDRSNAHLVAEVTRLHGRPPSEHVELDTSGVTFCDVAGAAALRESQAEVEAHGSICSTRTSPAVRHVAGLLEELHA